MKNLEQTLAKTLLAQYPRHRPEVDYDYVLGLRIAYKIIAKSMFGKEIAGDTDLEFIENLEKIANAEPQANLVEVTRFEAFGLYKHYSAKSVNAMQEGFAGASETYYEKAEKWLDVAVKIEQSDADGVGKNLMHI